MANLNDKVVLVTGAQQGIGRAIALALAQAGAHLIINYLDDPVAAKTLAEDIQALNVKALTVQGDVTDKADIERMLDAAEQLGGIDALVNNAAIFPRVGFLDMTEDDWDQVMNVNLRGVFLCTQASVRRMLKNGRAGSIVNLTSGAAFRSSPRGAHYVTSKAGLVGFTRAIALELAPQRIRANAIAPGLTDTAQPRYGMSEEELREAGTIVPLGNINQPEDVAGLAVFLISDAASMITGQTVHVNGGQYLY